MEISWLDFREEDRKIVLDILEKWEEPGTVDELGLGVIRDYFADKLFPGTSTRHTKAKYLVLTPYILRNLENRLPENIDDCIKKLNNEEMECAEKLITDMKNNKDSKLWSYEGGIIGENILKTYKGKRWVKVGPKDIYWSALKKYGIFKYPNFSLYGYLREIIEAKKAKKSYTFLKKETTEPELLSDDANIVPNNNTNNYWNLPLNAQENWKDDVCSVRLSKNEAEFLKERIITTQSNSLLAECLKTEERINDFVNLLDEKKDSDLFDNLEGLIQKWDLPEEIKKDYYIAKCVSDFLYCAQIRFDCIMKKQISSEKWEEYKKTIPEILKNKYLDLLFIPDNELGDIVNRSELLSDKLIDLKEKMSTNIESKEFECKLDKLIENWEIDNKGDKLAKSNKEKKDNQENSLSEKWYGIGKLNYRIRNAQNLVAQIREGLYKC